MDPARCTATAYSGKYRKWGQCSHRKLPGFAFCARHRNEQKHGIWQPAVEDHTPCANQLPCAGQPCALEPPVQHESRVPVATLTPLLCLLNTSWEQHIATVREQRSATPDVTAPAPKRRRAEPTVSPEILAQCVTPSDNKDQLQLQLYASFCEANAAELQALPSIGSTADTPFGRVFLSEAAVNAHLLVILERASLSAANRSFAALKKALRSLNLGADVLPAWCIFNAPAPPMISAAFRKRKRDDASTEAPSKVHGVITHQSAMAWAARVVCEDKAGTSCGQDIADALYIWVAAARSHREVNLTSVTWADVGYKELAGSAAARPRHTNQPFINIATTKPLGACSAQQSASMTCKVEFLVTDDIADYLFREWWGIAPDRKLSLSTVGGTWREGGHSSHRPLI